MKALTLTQPWASLVANQAKTIETRSFRTNYRGEMVIHAAKGYPRWAQDLATLNSEFKKALGEYVALPLGVGLCVVEVLGCVPMEELHKVEFLLGHKPLAREIIFGDYSPGRFAWVMKYVRPLENQQPVRGALGLWNWREA